MDGNRASRCETRQCDDQNGVVSSGLRLPNPLAMAARRRIRAHSMTQTGIIIGTPAYMGGAGSRAAGDKQATSSRLAAFSADTQRRGPFSAAAFGRSCINSKWNRTGCHCPDTPPRVRDLLRVAFRESYRRLQDIHERTEIVRRARCQPRRRQTVGSPRFAICHCGTSGDRKWNIDDGLTEASFPICPIAPLRVMSRCGFSTGP
jgi:hypothetical protein